MSNPLKNINVRLLDVDSTNGDKNPLKKLPTKFDDDTLVPTTIVGYDTGIGESKYDEGLLYDAVLQNDDIELEEYLDEYRAQRQPWGAKASAGLARVGAKAAVEVAKMPGFLVGAIGAPFAEEGEGWDTLVNNAWIRKVNELEDSINEDVLPVYVKRAVRDGNLWDNITSVDFWATEGADGAGFMLSMFAPGAAIKGLGVANKLANGASKLSNASDKFLKAAETLNSVGINPQNVELFTQTAANTMFEALTEAQGAGEAFQQDLDRKLSFGEVTEEQYNALMEKKAELMRNIFVANVGILAWPNSAMTKMIWGKGASKAVGTLTKPGGELLETFSKKGVWNNIKQNFVKPAAKASIREGAFEEGMQTTAEQYFTAAAEEGKSPGVMEALSDIPNAYLDMLTTTEGQKAVFLGSVLGSIADIGFGYKSRKRSDKRNEQLLGELQKLDGFYKIFTDDIYQVEDTGGVKLNNKALEEKLKAFQNLEAINGVYDDAIQRGDSNVVEDLRAYASGELIKEFLFSGNQGVDMLKQYLEESQTTQEISQKEQKDVEEITKGIIDRATKLQKDLEFFNQYAPGFITLENDNATNQDRAIFYDNLASRYISNKNLEYYLQDKLNSLKEQRGEMRVLSGLPREIPAENKLLLQQEKTNLALNQLNQNIANTEEALAFRSDITKAFWDSSAQQGEFDQFVNIRVKLDESLEQKKQEEIQKKLDDVNSATTEEELNNITKTNSLADSTITDAIKAKRKELRQLEEEKINDQIQSQEVATDNINESKDTEEEIGVNAGEYLANTFNPGEIFPITRDIVNAAGLDSKYIGEEAVIENDFDINDNDVTITLRQSGISTVVPRKVSKPDTLNADDTYKTEGSNYHTELIPKNNENGLDISKVSSKTGSKIISTDTEGNKFDFVSDAYLDYQREPIDKTGKSVGFSINFGESVASQTKRADIERRRQERLNSVAESFEEEYDYSPGTYSSETPDGERSIQPKGRYTWRDELRGAPSEQELIDAINAKYDAELVALEEQSKEGFSNKNWNTALTYYRTLVNNGTLTKDQIDFLINHLPINVVVAEGIEAPIETLPKTEASQQVFNKSSKLLRTAIVNALVQGKTIDKITTKIEGQYPGVLKVADKVEGQVPENIIFDLYNFKGMSDAQKIKYFRDNIAIVKENGDFEFTNGDTIPFVNKAGKVKSNAKGELYMNVPMANGKNFPLKLNIKKISEQHANLLYELFRTRLENEDITRDTTLSEIDNQELINSIKEDFSEELKLIEKPFKDITIRDLIGFLIWDGSKSSKTQIRFKGTGEKGQSVFVYGNPKVAGAEIKSADEFDKDHFVDWLMNNKRYSINFKPKKNQDNPATITTSNSYISYLINNSILNTNAVVNEPTFQGYSNIYLDSNNVIIEGENVDYTNIAAENEATPFNKDIDGSNPFSEVYQGETYYAFKKSGKVYKAKRKVSQFEPMPNIEEIIGEVVTDNIIIAAIENNIRTGDELFGDPTLSLKRYNNTLNSNNNFVSLHDVENTSENNKVEKLKEDIKKKDIIKDISKEQVMELFKRLRERKLIKIGAQSKSLLTGTNQENFNKLKEIADKNQVAIDDIITKCK